MMDDTESQDLLLPVNILQPLLVASGSSTLNEALDCLIETAKTSDGRSDLASKRTIVVVLQLCRFLLCPLRQELLFSSLKLLRNLCAGEIRNQNLFIEHNGVGVISKVVSSVEFASGLNKSILRSLLQVLGNVSLAGEEHQRVVWQQFFPHVFLEIAEVRSKEACDPLCMVMYTCTQGSNGLYAELCTDAGLDVIIEIIRTATIDGFREDWLKLLLLRICVEDSYFWSVFSKLAPVLGESSDDTTSTVYNFGAAHAFLLTLLSELLNEQITDIVVSIDFTLSVLKILGKTIEIVDFTIRGKPNLPTGSINIDVMGYSLTILRDICASTGSVVSNQNDKRDAVDTLVSAGLIEVLIALLRDLEPPAIIKKAMTQSDAKDAPTSRSSKYCPYKGFRRDIIAVIGNSCYNRKIVQDKIREENGIVLLLQHCVVDEENPFLREWGIWTMHNILKGNVENLKFVADLELRGTVDVPELAQMGLRVEVDPKTQRAKLVNIP